jgi:hypothetical protein
VLRWGARHARLSTLGYRLPDTVAQTAVPPRLRELHLQTARGAAVAQALQALKKDGLRPDVVVVHPGWGEALYLRSELPDVPLLGYCEFFYRADGADVGFDPEFPSSPEAIRQLQLRKAPHLLALEDIDAGVCPTEWQRAQFPTATSTSSPSCTRAWTPTPCARTRRPSWISTASCCGAATRWSPTSRATSSPTAASTSSCARCPTCSGWRRRRAWWWWAATRSATASACRPARATARG